MSSVETCKRWEKQIWNVVSVCRVWDFVGWSYFGGLGFPRLLPQKDAKVPFGGLSQYPSRHQGHNCRYTLEPVPLTLNEMMMTDEKLFQILRFAETFKRVSNKLHENLWTQVHRSWKITCDMVVQFDCLGFMVSCLSSLCCHCPMMIKDGAKETLSHQTIHLWGHPWPMKGLSFLRTSLRLSCCLDLSWYLSGP